MDWPDDVYVQISESHTGRCVRTSRYKYSVRCPGLDDDGKPVDAPQADEYVDDFLYDLQADPWELTNLIGMPSFREVVADMRARLVRRMKNCGESEPKFIDAPEAYAFQRQPEYHGGSLEQ
jgi:arylsulfatase A-like enzyme